MKDIFELIKNFYFLIIHNFVNYKIIINHIDYSIFKTLILLFLNILIFQIIKKMISNIIYRYPVLNVLFELPGTLFHELSHLLIALITFSKIKSFNIFPTILKTDNKISIKYGSVEYYTKRKFYNIFIGSAPLYINLTLLVLILNLFNFNNEDFMKFSTINLILIYLTSVILYSSLLSIQDIKSILSGVFTLEFILFILFIVSTLLYDYQVYIDFSLKSILYLDKYMLLFFNTFILLFLIFIYLVFTFSSKER